MGAGRQSLAAALRAGALRVGALCVATLRVAALLVATLLVGHAGAARAADATDGPAGTGHLCSLIQQAADLHGLPPAFLARLVWLESRFDVRAVSPKGALGVAQFMPATAKRRGLADPFDPDLAIPAAAAYLAQLRTQFGNLGLAAAAYNGGEDRVAAWLAGHGALPGETLAYVHAITFRPAGWFRAPGRRLEPRPLEKDRPFAQACRRLPVLATRAVLFDGAPWQAWGVQVAGNVRRAGALAQFSRVQARYPRIIGPGLPMMLRERMAGRPIWAVRLGAASRAEAQALCNRLRAAGGACVVQRN